MSMRGVNLGSWLNPEGYILGGRNIAYHTFESNFKEIYGKDELENLNKEFRSNYIKEEDFKRIASWGVKLLRIPFHYKLIEKTPYEYSDYGLNLLRWALDMSAKYDIKVILDLHAACGSQSADWHADSAGTPLLWDNNEFKERTYALWKYLVTKLGTHPALWAYDILNEPALYERDISVLQDFYSKTIEVIRSVDREVKIFLEGHDWSQDVDCLIPLLDKNICVSIHTYQPIQYVFNFRRGYSYPGFIEGENWNIDKIRAYLEPYRKFAGKYKTEIFVGEFGINYRKNSDGELDYLKDILAVFNEFDFHWTYWTYKSVAQSGYPDGIMQYLHNPSWICREGPKRGLETLYGEWKGNRSEILESWKTENFTENASIVKIIQKNL